MRGFSSADHKLTGEQKRLPLFVPIAMMFMWDVFVGKLGVVCGFSLKHLVTGKLSRHRSMDLEQLSGCRKRNLIGGDYTFLHALFVSLASSTSDYYLISLLPL